MTLDDDAASLALGSRMRGAIETVRVMIGQEYPSATFRLSRGPDDADQVLLWATVDLDDPEEVLDFVNEPLWQLEDEEGIILHVIPLKTPERVVADMRARDAGTRRSPLMSPPVKPGLAR
jgi:hypothetical protein